MCKLLLSILNGANEFLSLFKSKNNNKSTLEEEMDAYNLDEHEKDLVRKGLYDPWDFDTEGPFDDDDYYKDDDDYDNQN